MNAPADIRMPPHNVEAERCVIGGLMIQADLAAWDAIDGTISAADFYRHDHQLIFRSMESLARDNRPMDPVTVAEWLETAGMLDDTLGLSYLAQMAQHTPSVANVKAYAEIVRERSILRRLISSANTVADSALRPEGRNPQQLLDAAEAEFMAIGDRTSKHQSGPVHIADSIDDTIDEIERRMNRGGGLVGVSTGFKSLDAKTGGLQKSDLIILAARPAMGKTTLAMNIGLNVAISPKDPRPVAVFSMEMPTEQLHMRMLASDARIPLSDIRDGRMTQEDWRRTKLARDRVRDAEMMIDDTPALTPGELRSRCRRLQRETGGLGLVIIDYLQLMQANGRSENRANEISEISRSLKALAKELAVPVMALSQLNRALESRPDKRPVMSDLRESGAIEQDADVIAFVYRDVVYDPDTAEPELAEVLIRKQRNGPTGAVKLAFDGALTRFYDYSNVADSMARDEEAMVSSGY